ncbi:MAG: hypothetical protein KDN19_04290 [Verrucomicrobiae bacterium]|nr:hypothetical protein [Verrucomicrobiae bacterium]
MSHSLVRETTSPLAGGTQPDRQNASHHANEATLTENSSLFLIHQLRQQESTRPVQRSWWRFWRRD